MRVEINHQRAKGGRGGAKGIFFMAPAPRALEKLSLSMSHATVTLMSGDSAWSYQIGRASCRERV